MKNIYVYIYTQKYTKIYKKYKKYTAFVVHNLCSTKIQSLKFLGGPAPIRF